MSSTHPYDRSSKWLIQHHGGSILRLANIDNVESWRPAQAEVVQPRQLPDGLLDVRLAGESEDDLFLLEVATFPERRIGDQLARDLMLVYLDRGRWPEALTLVLHPKGKVRAPARRSLRSRRGLAGCTLKWRVVELWTIPAEQLLQTGDVGLIPWIPLSDYTDPPETIIRKCREEIDERAPPEEKANFLAVTQVLTALRYKKDPLFRILLRILGGKQVMIESPLIQEIVAENTVATVQQDVLEVLESRFGKVPADLAEQTRSLADERHLRALIRNAVSTPTLETFRKELER